MYSKEKNYATVLRERLLAMKQLYFSLLEKFHVAATQQTLAMYCFQFVLLNIKLVATIKSKHQIIRFPLQQDNLWTFVSPVYQI